MVAVGVGKESHVDVQPGSGVIAWIRLKLQKPAGRRGSGQTHLPCGRPTYLRVKASIHEPQIAVGDGGHGMRVIAWR